MLSKADTPSLKGAKGDVYTCRFTHFYICASSRNTAYSRDLVASGGSASVYANSVLSLFSPNSPKNR